jgi:hypothetical protein
VIGDIANLGLTLSEAKRILARLHQAGMHARTAPNGTQLESSNFARTGSLLRRTLNGEN